MLLVFFQYSCVHSRTINVVPLVSCSNPSRKYFFFSSFVEEFGGFTKEAEATTDKLSYIYRIEGPKSL